MTSPKQKAADLITAHFRYLEHCKPGVEDVLSSASEAGRKMVEIFRLLTGEMPQSPGIEAEFHGDETPAVEWASPIERDPNETYYVITGSGSAEPDILIKGDQEHGSEEKSKALQEENPQGGKVPKFLLRGRS